ncbi:MAG TPA: CdaR family protein [Pyrinomonadaceae bacterium]|nr:CdaR family protein [Pyrinomonadaceae bacterium]
MSIQDTDDLEYEAPQPPGFAERWLRRIFVEDLKIKLLALGITLVLWFAVTGQKRPVTKRLPGVQLTFVHSENMAISNDPPSRVDITVTGSKDELDSLNPSNMLATVVVGDNGAGNRVIRLTGDGVSIDPLPKNVHVDSFQPGVISVRLESKIDKQVDVKLKLEGSPPEGYEVRAATASPAKVRLRGPASIVNAIQQVSTESVMLEGKTSSFDLNSVAVDSPGEKVEILDSSVQVHVELAPRANNKISSAATVSRSRTAFSLFMLSPSQCCEELEAGLPLKSRPYNHHFKLLEWNRLEFVKAC